MAPNRRRTTQITQERDTGIGYIRLGNMGGALASRLQLTHKI